MSDPHIVHTLRASSAQRELHLVFDQEITPATSEEDYRESARIFCAMLSEYMPLGVLAELKRVMSDTELDYREDRVFDFRLVPTDVAALITSTAQGDVKEPSADTNRRTETDHGTEGS